MKIMVGFDRMLARRFARRCGFVFVGDEFRTPEGEAVIVVRGFREEDCMRLRGLEFRREGDVIRGPLATHPEFDRVLASRCRLPAEDMTP